ncbi:MAG: heavy-metal-associated domain-containing protein [Desulfobacterales bacterium]|nr:heavy-metal-associated domain-containing protein [Desulfobacterales bacterium]
MSESYELRVSGMNCMHCVSAVTRAMETVSEATDVVVSLEKAQVSFTAPDSSVREKVRDAIVSAGYSLQ